MKNSLASRLGWVVLLVEAASIAAIIFMPGLNGLPPKTGVVLVFLLPITFGLHVVEEFIFPGGGREWFKEVHPDQTEAYTDSYLFKVNAIPLGLAFLVTLGTFDFAGRFGFWGSRAWLVFLAMQFFNAIFHIRGALRLKSRRPAPGLITAVLLYIPLTIAGYGYFLKTGTVDIFSAVICFALGLLLEPALDQIRKRNMRKKAQHQPA
jgi:hypothetical protein